MLSALRRVSAVTIVGTPFLALDLSTTCMTSGGMRDPISLLYPLRNEGVLFCCPDARAGGKEDAVFLGGGWR